jgi:DNA-binding GntR family transcriptional regulator
VSRPAYQVLADELRDAISAGEYPPAQRLPTEAELASERGLSRQTVRKAFSELVAESLVYRVRGRGTFATPFTVSGPYVRSFGSIEELITIAIDTELEVITPLRLHADIDASSRLELPTNGVMSVVVRRLHHGEPFVVTTVVMPPALGALIGDAPEVAAGFLGSATILGLIEQRRPRLPIVGAMQSITAMGAPDELAGHIDCAPGQPVLRIDRLFFNREGERMVLAVTHANPMRFTYRLELRREIRSVSSLVPAH